MIMTIEERRAKQIEQLVDGVVKSLCEAITKARQRLSDSRPHFTHRIQLDCSIAEALSVISWDLEQEHSETTGQGRESTMGS